MSDAAEQPVNVDKVQQEYKRKTILEHLVGPFGSVIFHILIVFAAINLMVFTQSERAPEIEVMMTTPETVDLEDFNKELEKMDEIQEMSDVVTPTDVQVSVDTPTAVDQQTVGPSEDVSTDLSQLNMMNDMSGPLVMKGLFAGRSAGGRASALGQYGGDARTENAVLKALEWLKNHQAANGSWGAGGGDNQVGRDRPGPADLPGPWRDHGLGQVWAYGGEGHPLPGQQAAGEWRDRRPAAGQVRGWRRRQFLCAWHRHLCHRRGLWHYPHPLAQADDGEGHRDHHSGPAGRRRLGLPVLQGRPQRHVGGGLAGPGAEGSLYRRRGDAGHQGSAGQGGGLHEGHAECRDRADRLLESRLRQPAHHGGRRVVPPADRSCRGQGGRQGPPVHARVGPQVGQARIQRADVRLVLHHAGQVPQGGADWQSWNQDLRRELPASQKEDGHWEFPGEEHGSGAGFAYSTTLAALSLQVYYRFLPTYKPIAVEKKTEEKSEEVSIEII
jgi:hypothetical protein